MKKIAILIVFTLCFIGCVESASKLRNATEMSTEKEQETNKILTEIGLNTDIVKIEHDELLDGIYSKDGKGYRADFRLEGNSGVKNVTLYFNRDNDLERVRYNTKDFYKDGKVVDIIKNHIILPQEESEYVIFCTNNIKALLKSPSTATFPNITHWRMGKKDGKVIIQSYVDAQNGFGAMIRSDFQFIIDLKTNKVTSLIFEGKEFIK